MGKALEVRSHSSRQVETGNSPTHLCLLLFPFPGVHFPPHPRSDCSVLRLPFTILFCKEGREQGRRG